MALLQDGGLRELAESAPAAPDRRPRRREPPPRSLARHAGRQPSGAAALAPTRPRPRRAVTPAARAVAGILMAVPPSSLLAVRGVNRFWREARAPESFAFRNRFSAPKKGRARAFD